MSILKTNINASKLENKIIYTTIALFFVGLFFLFNAGISLYGPQIADLIFKQFIAFLIGFGVILILRGIDSKIYFEKLNKVFHCYY